MGTRTANFLEADFLGITVPPRMTNKPNIWRLFDNIVLDPYNKHSAAHFSSRMALTGPGGCSSRRDLWLVGPPSKKIMECRRI